MSDSALILREYNGTPIHQRRADGYFNATAMCKANGKFWGNYRQNQNTGEFLAELSGSIGIPIDSLVQPIMTGPNDERGTWVHRRVAIDLARWLSPRFAVAVNGWVDELLTTGNVSIGSPPQLCAPWAERLNSSLIQFRAEIYRVAGPGYWSVLTAMMNEMLLLGVVLEGYDLPLKSSDLPDGSAGRRYPAHREARGITLPVRRDIGLVMPHIIVAGEPRVVYPYIYHPDELATFNIWMQGTYLPECLPQYLLRKYPDQKYRTAALAAADEACMRLLGRPADLRAADRHLLDSAHDQG